MINLSLPFEVGKRYLRLDGKFVTCIRTVSHLKGYETAQFDDREETLQHIIKLYEERGFTLAESDKDAMSSGFRYNRPEDRGRCTGCKFDDPFNVIPEPNPNISKEHYTWLMRPYVYLNQKD